MDCKQCKIKYSRFADLRKHIKNKHPGELDKLAPIKNSSYKFSCNCGKTFNQRNNFNLHLTTHHPELKSEGSKKCPLCNFTGYFKTNLINHYSVVHQIIIEEETLQFNSETESNNWKGLLEKQELCSFVKCRGMLEKNSKRQNNWGCSRSGDRKSVV